MPRFLALIDRHLPVAVKFPQIRPLGHALSLLGNAAHKLGNVTFNIPMKNKKYVTRGSCCGPSGIEADTMDMVEDYLSPWSFTSDDGRFEMVFQPIIDRAACTDLKLICSDQHQVFGRFTGKVILDDGIEIEVKDFIGFAEKVMNKW